MHRMDNRFPKLGNWLFKVVRQVNRRRGPDADVQSSQMNDASIVQLLREVRVLVDGKVYKFYLVES